MGQRRRHLAHRHQARGQRDLLLLLAHDLLGGLAIADVGGDLQPCGAAVDPADFARAHVEPALERLVVGFAGACSVRREGLLQASVAEGVGAVQRAVTAVCEQQLARLVRGARGDDGDGVVERLQHGREALVRRLELLADALGLGDVRHRDHPAQLLAVVGQERRAVHARIEQRAVAPQHLQFESARRRLAPQQRVERSLVLGELARRPVGKGGAVADEGRLVPAGHLAERGVHVPQHAKAVDDSQPRGERVFHRATKGGLGAQCAFHPRLASVPADQRNERDQDRQRQAGHDPGEPAAQQRRPHPERRSLEHDAVRKQVDRNDVDERVFGRPAGGGGGQRVARVVQKAHAVAQRHIRSDRTAQKFRQRDARQHGSDIQLVGEHRGHEVGEWSAVVRAGKAERIVVRRREERRVGLARVADGGDDEFRGHLGFRRTSQFAEETGRRDRPDHPRRAVDEGDVHDLGLQRHRVACGNEESARRPLRSARFARQRIRSLADRLQAQRQ